MLVRMRHTRPGECREPAPDQLGSLRAIVEHYLRCYGEREWVAFHRSQRPIQKALEVVASFKDDNGKTYSHQSLVPRDAKQIAGRRIRRLELRDVTRFDEIFERVEAAIGSIRGVGELTVYDVAARIGASLGLMPDRVYLQSGARVGARIVLGRPIRERSLPADAFPTELQRLAAWQIEDVLCIYKDELARIPENDPSDQSRRLRATGRAWQLVEDEFADRPNCEGCDPRGRSDEGKRRLSRSMRPSSAAHAVPSPTSAWTRLSRCARRRS